MHRERIKNKIKKKQSAIQFHWNKREINSDNKIFSNEIDVTGAPPSLKIKAIQISARAALL